MVRRQLAMGELLAGFLRRRSPRRHPSFQPGHRLSYAVEDPGIEAARTQRLLRLPIERLDGRRAWNQRQLEILRDRQSLRHGPQRITQPPMTTGVVVTRLQQRTRHVVADAHIGETPVRFGELQSVAAAEIDAHIVRVFRDAGEVVHRCTLASAPEPVRPLPHTSAVCTLAHIRRHLFALT